MANNIAKLTLKLATDDKFLKEWNKGKDLKEWNANRTAIMTQMGLSATEQDIILDHDNHVDEINKALAQGVSMKLDSWLNTQNSNIRVTTL